MFLGLLWKKSIENQMFVVQHNFIQQHNQRTVTLKLHNNRFARQRDGDSEIVISKLDIKD